jgi:asparagine synthetase B (glutamine-hydrolysing)
VLGRATGPAIEVAALGSGLRDLAAGADEAAAALARRWERDAEGLLDGLPPDIAVVVLDHEDATLTAGTTGGSHRLFVSEDDRGGVRLSNVLTLVVRATGRVTADRGYEDFLLAHGFLPEGRTPFVGVRALPAATLARWPGGELRAVTPVTSVEQRAAPPVRGDPTASLLDLLTGAVEEQAGRDREHAVLLGGLDSALVAALLRRLGHRVHAYTFGFGDARYDQANVDLVVDTLGCEHTWVRITPGMIADGLRHFASVYNQPVPQPHYLLHTLYAARAVAADGFSHVFTGDGCDAAFLGFPTVNRRARALAIARRIPMPLVHAALRVTAGRPFERHLGQPWRMARGLLDDLAQPVAAQGHLPFTILGDVSRARLRRNAGPEAAEPLAEIRLRLAGPARDLDSARRAFHGHALTGQSATKVEGAVADTGMAMLSPYLHPKVRAFAMALPTELLRPAGSAAGASGKDLLVRTVLEHRLLPETVVRQPKQSPSTSPVDEWYAGPLRPVLFDLLDGLPFAWDRGYVADVLRPKRAEDLYRRYVSNDRYAFRVIGLLCSYAAFFSTVETPRTTPTG